MAIFSGKAKIRRKHIIASGWVDSGWQLDKYIREGIISKPEKDGTAMQSRVFWWPEVIEADYERYRAKRTTAA
ncbi:hypothetical protein [Ensifer adhaerens]|jgi:hypothetical protein|uniref:hypothetical protein n=1 Tax=Ensifer adhaerens TaxID=106592 RepID=UPI002030C719|nr:hypothetical protein [Ensifer adhaerens]